MKIGVLGCGVMGSAMARRFASNGYALSLYDRNPSKREALAAELSGSTCSSIKELVAKGDLILLAVKPKDLGALKEEMGNCDGKWLLSIIAGATTGKLKASFPQSIIIRSMPNLSIGIGEGVIALVEDSTHPQGLKQKIDTLLEGVGMLLWTPEASIDAITALAGSGPAFIVAMIESMIESGILMGLKADDAKKLALQTVIGAVGLIEAESGHPGQVRWQICAPGGTTIAGMHAFEENGVRAGIMNTFLATYDRAREI